jgi:predicted nucleic acid-binding protein
VIAVSDSSPLIVLAKLDCFDLLRQIFTRVYISVEVYREVAVSGSGRPGAAEVEKADWIETKALQNKGGLLALQEKSALGIGEISTILLAKEIQVDAVLLDDFDARKLARTEGLEILGTVGLLEGLYLRGYLADLRDSFRQLAMHSYIDQRLLDARLLALGLPQL